MKAAPAVQRTLLDLAEIDIELNRVAHRRGSLPELTEITGIEAEAATKRDAVTAAATVLADLRRDADRLEKEVDQVRARGKRDEDLLKAGNVSARQVADLEHELESVRRRQGLLEDELLELMERIEAAETQVSVAEGELAEVRQRLEDAERRRDEALADLGTVEARQTEAREAVVGSVPEGLLALYERLRAQKGTGAALLRARRCGACRLELDRTALSELRKAAADDVVRCEECGVILVRTGESGL
ncbi:zinc ribbon domain-containing protein [Actinoalloteichus spitiensis]|uniref:zinc ribbon domain-containing protein n=1 Tax=Actinoalloteichus spitiensis TaxID=252394 RepID=UPI00035C3F61|nr:C4-type zinc ribbon domain-containing protein [Actinoalloteichus spitiensis]